jgi:16S rRNA (cytosine967-C5)-methyltransferase
MDAMEYDDEGGFDRVLIDAPCSGLGTLTKKPDLKWKRDLGDIRKIVNIQYELLNKGASLVKINGSVVYSTCTIEPEENFDLIKRFLSDNPNFSIERAGANIPGTVVNEEGYVATLPHVHGVDGAFAVKLIRHN